MASRKEQREAEVKYTAHVLSYHDKVLDGLVKKANAISQKALLFTVLLMVAHIPYLIIGDTVLFTALMYSGQLLIAGLSIYYLVHTLHINFKAAFKVAKETKRTFMITTGIIFALLLIASVVLAIGGTFPWAIATLVLAMGVVSFALLTAILYVNDLIHQRLLILGDTAKDDADDKEVVTGDAPVDPTTTAESKTK